MKNAMVRLQQEPADPAALDYALSLARTLHALPFGLNLWQAQNIWYELYLQGDAVFAHAHRDGHNELHREKGEPSQKSIREHWHQLFPELGRQLDINVDHLVPEPLTLADTKKSAGDPPRNRRHDDPKPEKQKAKEAAGHLRW
jgi:hypothetical protein